MSESWLNGYLLRDDYFRNVARGLVAGAQPFSGFGRHVASGAESGVLWPNGAYAFPPTTGVQMSIVSTSADDAAAGTGIRTLELHYLNANLEDQHETVTMAGLTPVLTVATDIRFIQCAHLTSVGSGKKAAGVITASNGGTVYAQINTGDVRCTSSVRMVPKGKRLLVVAVFGGSVSGTAAASTLLNLATPNFEGHNLQADGVFIPLSAGGFQDTSAGTLLPCPASFTEGQAVGMIYNIDKAGTITGSWFGILEEA